MRPDDGRYFFVHVMKTGGATFEVYLRQNFRPEQVYGLDNCAPRGPSRQRYYVNTRVMLDHVRANRERLRVIRGHVPFAVATLIGEPVTTLTILRDPVERTVSYLQHCQRHHPEHASLRPEQIYEDPWYFETFIHNYQVKLFSMTPAETLVQRTEEEDAAAVARERTSRALYSWMGAPLTETITVDDARLAAALQNVERADVVGFTDRYDAFLDELERRFGWRRRPVKRLNTGEEAEISSSLRRRIERDQEAEIEFYQSARRRVQR